MTSTRWWRSSVPVAGKLAQLDVVSIGAGSIRLDLLASVPPDHDRDDRYTMVVDLDTARAMAILLIRGIEQAEVAEAKRTKQRKKK